MNLLEVLSYREWKLGLLFAFAGLIIGWLVFDGVPQENAIKKKDERHVHEAGSKWTCSMHPQIRKMTSGTCPICGMDLIPVEDNAEEVISDYVVRLTDAAMKMAEVSTALVLKETAQKEVTLFGKVKADERNASKLTARFPGRIEKLFVNHTGQVVKKGEVLAKIYSPDLIAAQKELFEAVKFKSTNPDYYEAARSKLKLWGLSQTQLTNIEKSGKLEFYSNILSPLSGTVINRNVSLGEYVKEGTTLFDIVDLTNVWVVFDAYESDLPWIRINDKVNFTLPSVPDEIFESVVSFIDPIINVKTRTSGVRVEISNKNGSFKPEMLASGKLHATLFNNKKVLLVPKSAVLWTGKNAVVYVKTNDHQNLFQYREVRLGVDADEFYVVTGGLAEGEEVATNGVFKIDAAAQLNHKKSMMNPLAHQVSMKSSTNMDFDLNDKKGHKETNQTITNQKSTDIGVDSEFKMQIKDVLKNYLTLKDAFVDSDVRQATLAAENVEISLTRINISLIQRDSGVQWIDFLNTMKKETAAIRKSTKIEEQRASFLPLSEALYKSLKYFKVDGVKTYYQFCPMANDNKGAGWLSVDEEVRNPYFGEKMLGCGSTEEFIK